jgi:hypothetical protein
VIDKLEAEIRLILGVELSNSTEKKEAVSVLVHIA